MRGSCIAGFWTQGFSTIYMGKPVASRFGGKNSGLINFDSVPGNRVYHLPKSVSFNEKRPRKPETNIRKWVWRHEIQISAWNFPTGKYPNAFSHVPFVSRIFPLKSRKQHETELMVSLAKHHPVASWFIHDFIQVYRLLFGIHVAFCQFWDPGDGGYYNGLYGEGPPERGTFFRLQVYERVGILLVVVYERVEKSVISVCERAEQMNFMAV